MVQTLILLLSALAKQPPDMGAVTEIAEVGGLHHRYERRAV